MKLENTEGALSGYEKDLLVSFFKHQHQQIKEIIDRLEADMLIEKSFVKDFFKNKSKVENKILDNILN